MILLNDPPRIRSGAPDWTKHKQNWPHSHTSRFLQIDRETWHIQRMGAGPRALLLHGTGASTHSWAGLFPMLAAHYDLLAIDLPGHGFSQMRPGFVPSLPNVTMAISRVLKELDFWPKVIIGHSAGAAIAINLAKRNPADLERIVSLNGALQPFAGAMGIIAPMTAKLVTFGGFAARALSSSAKDIGRVERLLLDTGSVPSRETLEQYAVLMRSREHVQGTLQMMANWDLSPMEAICAELDRPILFVTGSKDRTVPPDTALDLSKIARNGRYLCIEDVGHLAHEEAPAKLATAILNH